MVEMDGRWERGEQHGGARFDAVRARVVAYCSTRFCEVAAKGVPVVCFDRVPYCKGRLEKDEQCVKTETVSARQAKKDDKQAPELDDLFFTLFRQQSSPDAKSPIPINDPSAVSKSYTLSSLISHNKVS